MLGNSDTRETSALSLGKLVRLTPLDTLKPFVIQITGPLIRVIGDRFNPNVKSAILQTLGQLLQKVPTMLRPFLPQLQRTFVKSLTEQQIGVTGGSGLRETAAQCLSFLIPLQPRLDPLLVELVQSCQTAQDKSIKEAVLEALYGLVKGVLSAGRELTPASLDVLRELIVGIHETSIENEGAFCSLLYYYLYNIADPI
jgi:hypothetical protein